MEPIGEHLPKPSNPASSTYPLVSTVLTDGTAVEMLYRPDPLQTSFCVYRDETWTIQPDVVVSGTKYVPYSPSNNLLKHEVVLFPSEPEEYESEESLIAGIQSFLHRYVDVSPLFEQITAYYILFSWVYDAFAELPYLRVRGDYGCGKTRFLLIAGSLCYKPIFASGASTISPIFRILDVFRGTLIIDEGDFRMSDERAEIVKILNNGNVKGFPVLRSEVTRDKEFKPTAFSVYGPKIVATRGDYQDPALESRFIKEEMGTRPLREKIPINLPPAFKEEALHLRNQLLLFRFRNRNKCRIVEGLIDRSIEPRLNQIFVPLLSIIEDGQARKDLKDLARSYQREMTTERGMDTEAQVLEVIHDLQEAGEPLSIKEITRWFADRHGEEYERKITPKWIGYVIRKKLHLKAQRIHGSFIIDPTQGPLLKRLLRKYGVSENVDSVPESMKGPLGDMGDFEVDDEAEGQTERSSTQQSHFPDEAGNSIPM